MSETSPKRTEERLVYTHLELLLVVTIWAGTFVATKVVLEQIPPALSALYRYLIASVILLGVNFRNREKVKKEHYPSFIFLALTGVTLYYLFQHYGIKYTNATDAAVLISISPVFICIISWFLIGEPVRPVTVAGLILAFTGSLLVITDGKITLDQWGERFWGDILILLTAVSWALYSAYGKKLLNNYSVKTLITNTTIIGTVFLIPVSLPEIARAGSYSLDWVGWANLLYLGGAASVYGYLAWYRALTKLPAVTVGSYLYFRPLLTGIIAAAALGEKVGLFVIAGGVLIILGTYLSTIKKISDAA